MKHIGRVEPQGETRQRRHGASDTLNVAPQKASCFALLNTTYGAVSPLTT